MLLLIGSKSSFRLCRFFGDLVARFFFRGGAYCLIFVSHNLRFHMKG